VHGELVDQNGAPISNICSASLTRARSLRAFAILAASTDVAQPRPDSQIPTNSTHARAARAEHSFEQCASSDVFADGSC